MQRFAIRIITISLLMMSLTACVRLPAYQAYGGDKRPESEISTLRNSNKLHIISFDGKSVKPKSASWDGFFGRERRSVEMIPGNHTVTLHYYVWGWGNTSFYYTLRFTSEAGHNYTARYDYSNNCGWIEDNISGHAIAENDSCENN